MPRAGIKSWHEESARLLIPERPHAFLAGGYFAATSSRLMCMPLDYSGSLRLFLFCKPRLFISEDLTAFHDEDNTQYRIDVIERTLTNRNDVHKLASFKHAK
jgi:hypothetical protein